MISNVTPIPKLYLTISSIASEKLEETQEHPEKPHNLPSPKPIEGVTLCLRKEKPIFAYPTRIFCDCRDFRDLVTAGIYFVKRNRGRRGSDSEDIITYYRSKKPIQRIRVFPKRYTRVDLVENCYFLAVTVGLGQLEDIYPHLASDCDLLISFEGNVLTVSPNQHISL